MTPLVLAGPGHPALAAEVARELGVEPAPCRLERFPDGELEVRVERCVRGARVFVVQPLGPPAGERLLELLLLADACRRAGAAAVTAVAPYVGYARQDRLTAEGQPLGARVVADVLGAARLDLLVAVDLHSPVIASCLAAPVAHLTAVPVLVEALRPLVRADAVVVAPDLGAVKLAESCARRLALPLAVVSKSRVSPDEVAVRSVVGEVEGRQPVLVDDMIATGGTLHAAVDALLAHRCRPEVLVAATHGLFVGEAAARLDRPEVLRVVATDSLPPAPRRPPRLEVARLAPLLAEAVRRIVAEASLDDLLARR